MQDPAKLAGDSPGYGWVLEVNKGRGVADTAPCMPRDVEPLDTLATQLDVLDLEVDADGRDERRR